MGSVVSPPDGLVSPSVDISSQQRVGYIVSHWNYGKSKYASNINKTLTLTGVASREIEITIVSFNVDYQHEGECNDYLRVDNTNFCGNLVVPYNFSVNNLTDHITFLFATDKNFVYAGFRLQYRGMLTVIRK